MQSGGALHGSHIIKSQIKELEESKHIRNLDGTGIH